MELLDGRAVLAMPFREELVTVGRAVHGGAVASLLDTTAMAAAWCGAPEPDRLQGQHHQPLGQLSGAGGRVDLVAEGTVLRRGRSIAHVQEQATADRRPVAQALVSYTLG